LVKTTLNQLGKRLNSVYMASDFDLNIWTCWNTELQRVQVNMSILRGITVAEKHFRLFRLLGSLLSKS